MLHGAVLLAVERPARRCHARHGEGETIAASCSRHSPGCSSTCPEGSGDGRYAALRRGGQLGCPHGVHRDRGPSQAPAACLSYWDYGEGYGAPAINPKKPYGNSDVERDIAEILDAPDSDWEWDEDDEYLDLTPGAREHFTRLHVETMIVLHIVLAARDTRPGRYFRDDAIGWVRAEDEGAKPGRG